MHVGKETIENARWPRLASRQSAEIRLSMSLKTIKEVAELASVSTRTVRRWIERGELQTIDVSSQPSSRYSQHRITEGELERFFVGRQPTTADPVQRRNEPRPADWVDYF